MEQKMTPIRKKPKLTKSDYYFKCAFCHEELDDDAALKVHIESKHLDDLFKFPCEHCEYRGFLHGGAGGSTAPPTFTYFCPKLLVFASIFRFLPPHF